MRSFIQDAQYALRGLRNAPGFYAVAVITLALGIGANTAMFTLVNGVLLRSLPYDTPDGLVAAWQKETRRGNPRNTSSPANFRDWQEQNGVFEGIAAYYETTGTVTIAGELPERVRLGTVQPGFFAVLRVNPVSGRMFRGEEGEVGNHHVVILSHEYWYSRFAADTDIVGLSLALNRVSHEIVGVAPPGVDLPDDVSLWRPLALDERTWNNRGSHYLGAVARLAGGVTLDQARADLETIADRLALEYPREQEGWGVTVAPLHDDLVGDVRPALLLLQGAVFVVLLIACVNVANLQLARGSARQGEFAVRTALGAGRGRLMRQLLTESLLLASLGAALGIGIAQGAVDLVSAMAPAALLSQTITLDLPVLVFTLVLTGLTGVIFGIAPAIQGARTDVVTALVESGRRISRQGRRFREGLVVAEVGLSFVLLVGAGLLVNSFVRLVNVDPGVDPENLLTVRVSIPASEYSQPLDRATFFQRLHRTVGEVPGVESVGMASLLPITGSWGMWRNSFHRPENPPATPADQVAAMLRWISPGYLQTMGIPLLRGHGFTELDTEESPHGILIDQTMARQFFPGEDPIGKRLVIEYNDWEGEIIGIVGNTRQASLGEPLEPHMYVSYLQTYSSMYLASMTLAIRTRQPPETLVAPVRTAVLSLDDQLAPYQIETFERRVSTSVAAERFNLWLVIAFAIVAVILAAVGLYGVISYMVGQRTRELGVRMALGAREQDVLALVLRHGTWLTVLGIGVGLAGIAAVQRVLTQFLFGVSANDPPTIVALSALLAGIALIAVLVPARRAARTDPMAALRCE
jgi:putative ABC transport system permease protein